MGRQAAQDQDPADFVGDTLMGFSVILRGIIISIQVRIVMDSRN